MAKLVCRICRSSSFEVLIDLGDAPISNSLLVAHLDMEDEKSYPLSVVVCMNCGFCQLGEDSERETHFNSEYVYFSSYSSSWLEHCEVYAEKLIDQYSLGKQDLVLEIASNDGYMLKHFKSLGIPVLGVEPSANVAAKAEDDGVETIVDFFGARLGKELSQRNLRPKIIIANNVLAHVPDIVDFICGLSEVIANDGIISLEFPHLYELIVNSQFDTIYHEHYSYLSISALKPAFEAHGLEIFDIERIPTHGGSLRVCARKRIANVKSTIETSVSEILDLEATCDPRDENIRKNFQKNVEKIVADIKSELTRASKSGVRIAGYGAAAKGNTLLNYAGIGTDLLDYIIDSNPTKQGKFSPGSHIPIVAPEHFARDPIDIFLVLPWNLSGEISKIVRDLVKNRPIKLLRAIPTIEYFD